MWTATSLVFGGVMLLAAVAMLWQAHRSRFSPVGGIVALAAAGLSALRAVGLGGSFHDELGLAASIAFAVSPLLHVLSYRSALRKGTYRGPVRIVTDNVPVELK